MAFFFFAGPGAGAGVNWGFGVAPEASALACIAKSLAFRPSEACRSSTSILYSYHLIFDLLLQHGM